ncbi:MAG: hypothetical protein RJA22_2729 [Verrucomicrobiota bacterium]|jgi:hypothetical protein
MKFVLAAGLSLLAAATLQAQNSVTPWVPIFKGVDQATGTNNGSLIQLSVDAIRVDLQDPDVQLMVTPAVTTNYVTDSRETVLQTPREFMRQHGVQVAVNGCWFSPAGYGNPSGTPSWLAGPVISQGRTVSSQSNSNDSQSAMFFTTNKQASFYANNWPAADTTGQYTAMSGLYPLLVDGVNISYAYTNGLVGSSSVHSRQPRSALGLSQDNRYLIIVSIDGRQTLSDGAYDYETAEFLQLFGAWNGMNIDGGGSTCMVKADDCGQPVDVNQNSYQFAVSQPGSQRPVGCNLGVYARALPRAIETVQAQPGTTTALLTWRTAFPSTTQVQYGPTTNYGSSTPLDPRLVRSHVATLTGLPSGSNVYFRVLSSDGTTEHSFACSLTTTTSVARSQVYGVTSGWKYTTNNLDGINWKSVAYDDSSWFGPSNGCFHIDNTVGSFAPKTTLLPPGFVVPIFRCYYFRKGFEFNGSTNGVTLTLSNYIDDGAVFYLNGNEVARYRVAAAPTVLSFTNFATGANPCPGGINGDASLACPEQFTVSGANLRQGTNIIAVEVHNVSGGTTSQDIFFGSGLFLNQPTLALPKLFISSENGQSTLYWNGLGYTLQRSSDLTSTNGWTDVPGPLTQSPVVISEGATTFYRLRN